jgi:hypothetical protein
MRPYISQSFRHSLLWAAILGTLSFLYPRLGHLVQAAQDSPPRKLLRNPI